MVLVFHYCSRFTSESLMHDTCTSIPVHTITLDIYPNKLFQYAVKIRRVILIGLTFQKFRINLQLFLRNLFFVLCVISRFSLKFCVVCMTVE